VCSSDLCPPLGAVTVTVGATTGALIAVHQLDTFATGTLRYKGIDRYPAKPHVDRPAPRAHVILDGTPQTTAADGSVKTFKTSAAPPVDAQWRTMDCIDCHNRPSHIYREPAIEIDAALADGRIDTSLPYIKREGLRLIKVDYASEAQARAAISKEVDAFYRAQYPAVTSERASAVTQAGKALGDIWSWNVFPQMKVAWNTYPNHIGHQQSPGCLRCHDNKHVTETGAKISKKCDVCHNVVAEDEAAPEVLKALE
jgi:hypothetical protein